MFLQIYNISLNALPVVGGSCRFPAIDTGKKQGWPQSHPLSSPQDYVEDVYLSVRLEAGTLHLANYLIHTTFYYLATKVTIII